MRGGEAQAGCAWGHLEANHAPALRRSPSLAALPLAAIAKACVPLPPPPAGKEIHWIEWGIGGGMAQTGDQPANNASAAAWWPYFGIFGPYNASRDPWRNPEVRDYM